MAGADYKSCEVCGSKTFYDAVLDYDFKEYNKVTGLHRTADHKSLCEECGKKYELLVAEKSITSGSGKKTEGAK